MQITDKKALRKQMKQLRVDMPDPLRKAADHSIACRFLESDEYKACDYLLMYVSSEIEVDTLEILTQALKEKKVVCPRCEKTGSIMYFYKVSDFCDLETGAYGISEPKADCERISEFTTKSVCVVPALSFDDRGFRLGFGKGYYDRFLSGFQGVKLGVCYDECLVPQLPCDKYDISADLLITQSKVFCFR